MPSPSRIGCASVLMILQIAGTVYAEPPELATAEELAEPPFRETGPGPAPKPAAAPVAPEAAPEPPASRFHITLGIDYTTAYYFRGIRQEDSGLILQPYADIAFDFLRSEDLTLSAKLGAWNSFHAEATGADSDTDDDFTRYWYEADLYAGLGLAFGHWSLDARYYFYTSPSGAFNTVEEFDFGVSYDDSEIMGPWALRPSAVIAFETASEAADGDHAGAYLQLGISPGFAFDAEPLKGISLSFPVVVGLSLDQYYESADDDSDDAFGYVSVGARLAVPLSSAASAGEWGAWTLNLGVQGLFLGDAASSFNGGDDAEFIATVGVSVSF